MFHFFFKKKAPNYEAVKKKFELLVDNKSGVLEIENELLALCKKYPKHTIKYKKVFFVVMKDIATEKAVKYAEDVIKEEENIDFLRVLAVRYKRIGNIERHDQLMEKVPTTPKTINKKVPTVPKKINKKLSIIDIRKELEQMLKEKKDYLEIEEYVVRTIKKYPSQKTAIEELTFILFKDVYTRKVVKYAESVLVEKPSSNLRKVLATRYKQLGNIKRYKELAAGISQIGAIAKHLKGMLLENASYESIDSYVTTTIDTYPDDKLKISKLVFTLFKDIHTDKILKYGEFVIQEDPSDDFISVLANRYKQIGNIERYNQLMKEISPLFEIEEKLLKMYSKREEFPSIEKFLTDQMEKSPEKKIDILKLFFKIFKTLYSKEILRYVEKNLSQEEISDDFKNILLQKYREIGDRNRCKKLKQWSEIFKQNECKAEAIASLKKGTAELEKFIDEKIYCYPHKQLMIFKIIFSLLKDIDTKLALKYGELVGREGKDIPFIRVLMSRYKRIGDREQVYNYAKFLFKETGERMFMNEIILYEHNSDIEQFKYDLRNEEIGVDKNIESYIEKMLLEYVDFKEQVYKIAALIYSDTDISKAIMYIKKGLLEREGYDLYLKLFEFYIKKGDLNMAVNSMPDVIENQTLQKKVTIWKENIDLLNNGFKFEESLPENKITSTDKVLYLLHNTLPFHSGGYATRAHGLMTGVNKSKMYEMQAVSRLGYPQDILKLSSDADIPMKERIDNITYHRLKSSIKRGNTTYYNYIKEYGEAVVTLAKKEKPFVIHAASNLYNGLACIYAAKKMGLKSIYEVRGLWEITRISREPEWEGSDMFLFNKNMETTAAMNADVVITITQALKDEMIARGVDGNKIEVLPNGVVSDRFHPLEKNINLAKKLNLENKTVIGFIGSFAQYEGLDYLVDAVRILVDRGISDIGILMVGDGAVWEETKERVTRLGLDDYFVFTGRVAHEEVEEYYSLVDIAPFPRKGLPVCEMVSPLKPFEAMAMEKAVLSSNVAALEEIVKDEYNGLLFEKDNVDDFADKLETLITDKSLRLKLGQNAREWVIKERDWNVLSGRLNLIYRKLFDEE